MHVEFVSRERLFESRQWPPSSSSKVQQCRHDVLGRSSPRLRELTNEVKLTAPCEVVDAILAAVHALDTDFTVDELTNAWTP